MREKEKMLLGMLYDANNDEELIKERIIAKDLCFEFNHLKPSQEEEGQEILKKLFYKMGEGVGIVAPFYCDYGYNITVGDGFFANHNTVIVDCAPVIFGDHVFIAPHCGFYTAGHPIDAKRRNAGLEYAYPITVGSNVWIGAGVHVMPGVTIGHDVVIGAGSVVTRDIPDYSVAVGNPCRVIRKITEADELRDYDFKKK